MSLYGQAVYFVILGVGSDKPNKQRSFIEKNHTHNPVLVAFNVKNESVITHIINVIKRLPHID
jgi:peroxiredoxin